MKKPWPALGRRANRKRTQELNVMSLAQKSEEFGCVLDEIKGVEVNA